MCGRQTKCAHAQKFKSYMYVASLNFSVCTHALSTVGDFNFAQCKIDEKRCTGVLPISLPFEHCVLRELMRTSLLIRDGLRKENTANLHRQTGTH